MLSDFSSSEIARLAGFHNTLMLNYLERSGTFRRENAGIPHHGKKRKYTFRDLVVLRAINRLLKLGARPKRIEEAMATFARIQSLPSNADALVDFARRSSLFVVTHDQVIYCEPDGLVELTKSGQLAFSFMVDNRLALKPVAEAVLKYEKAIDKQPRNKAILIKILENAELA